MTIYYPERHLFDVIGLVTPRVPNPNQIINELVGFFNTFLPDMRSLGYANSVSTP